MDRYNHWWTIVSGALLGILIGSVVYIVLPPGETPQPRVVRPNVVVVPPLVPQTSVPNDEVSTLAIPDTSVVEDVELDIGSPLFLTIPAEAVFSVCDDFDNGLWFWDMYEERLEKFGITPTDEFSPWLTSEDNADVMLLNSMGDEVALFCPDHQNKLPTELLLPDVLLPGQSD